MTLHSGEQWAIEAGAPPDDKWCPRCQEYVPFDYEEDEHGFYYEWCRLCNGELGGDWKEDEG